MAIDPRLLAQQGRSPGGGGAFGQTGLGNQLSFGNVAQRNQIGRPPPQEGEFSINSASNNINNLGRIELGVDSSEIFAGPSSGPERESFLTGLNLANAAFGELEIPEVVTAETGIAGQLQGAGEERLAGGDASAQLAHQANLQFGPSDIAIQLSDSGAGLLGPSALGQQLQQGGLSGLESQGALEAALQQQALGGLSGQLTSGQQQALQVEQNRINQAANAGRRNISSSFASRGLGGGGGVLAQLRASDLNREQSLAENQIGFGQRSRQEALQQGQLSGNLAGQRQAFGLNQIGAGTDIGALQNQQALQRLGLSEDISGNRFNRALGATRLGEDISATEFAQGTGALSTAANLAGSEAQQQNVANLQNFLAQQGLSQAQVNTILGQQGLLNDGGVNVSVGSLQGGGGPPGPGPGPGPDPDPDPDPEERLRRRRSISLA